MSHSCRFTWTSDAVLASQYFHIRQEQETEMVVYAFLFVLDLHHICALYLFSIYCIFLICCACKASSLAPAPTTLTSWKVARTTTSLVEVETLCACNCDCWSTTLYACGFICIGCSNINTRASMCANVCNAMAALPTWLLKAPWSARFMWMFPQQQPLL